MSEFREGIESKEKGKKGRKMNSPIGSVPVSPTREMRDREQCSCEGQGGTSRNSTQGRVPILRSCKTSRRELRVRRERVQGRQVGFLPRENSNIVETIRTERSSGTYRQDGQGLRDPEVFKEAEWLSSQLPGTGGKEWVADPRGHKEDLGAIVAGSSEACCSLM